MSAVSHKERFTMEKTKKSIKKIALKIIIAVLFIWVVLAVTDLIRFVTSDGYIEPLFTVTQCIASVVNHAVNAIYVTALIIFDLYKKI